MQRNLNIDRELDVQWARPTSDEEALLLQLMQALYQAGFLYDDASFQERHSGNLVLRCWFKQEPQLLLNHLNREQFQRFMSFVEQQHWTPETLPLKLHRRLVKSFDTLCQGQHHAINVSRNLRLGLQTSPSPLRSFTLQVQSYGDWVLEPDEKDSALRVSDAKSLLKLRGNLQQSFKTHYQQQWVAQTLQAIAQRSPQLLSSHEQERLNHQKWSTLQFKHLAELRS